MVPTLHAPQPVPVHSRFRAKLRRVFGPTLLPRKLGAALTDAGDPKVEVRRSALRDLARLGDEPEAVARIAELLRRDDSPLVQAEAALALADVGSTAHLDVLATAARTGEPRVRQMSLVALGELAEEGHARARDAVLAALSAVEPALRYQALVASRRVLGADAEPHIVEAMADEDDEVRYIAWRIAEERWLDVGAGELSKALAVRARAALDDTSGKVRMVAALLLARAGDAGGADVVVEVLNGPTGRVPIEDEQAAIELAGELGLEAASRGLERRAFGGFFFARDPFVWHARVALARLGHERASQEILRGLTAWTRDARTLAVAAAGRARLSRARPLLERMRTDARQADPSAVADALAALDDS